MKKIICLLISLFSVIGICFADDVGPDYVEVNALVNNEDGAYVYIFNDNNKPEKTSKVLEKGAEIKISWDYDYKGTNYYKLENLKFDNDDDYYIKESDFVVVSIDKILKDDYKKSAVYYIFDSSKVVLREGPSSLYKKIEVEIPNNVEVKSDYNIDDLYVRVDINGTKGWVDLDDFSLAEKVEKKLMIYKNTSVYSYPNKKSALKISFPIDGTTFKSVYTYYDNNYDDYYGFKGNDGNLYWVYDGDVLEYRVGNFFFGADAYLYSDVNLNESTKIMLKNNLKITGFYYGNDSSWNDICYFSGDSHNKSEGYFDCDYIFDEDSRDEVTYMLAGDLVVYTSVDFKTKAYTVNAGSLINVDISCFFNCDVYRVTYDGVTGWVRRDANSLFTYSDYSDDEYDEDYEDDDIYEEDYEDEIDEDIDVDDSNQMSPKEYIIIGILGAVILALSSFVTIKCINKSKKDSKIDNKDNTSVEEKVENNVEGTSSEEVNDKK